MKIGVVSLGCAKNLVDTEITLGFLRAGGHEIVAQPLQAQIIIINTCGFIEQAQEESVNAILEMAALKEKGCCQGLIVMGCLSQRYSQELWEEIPEIDALLGTQEFDLINSVIHRILQGERVWELRGGLFDYNKVYERVSTTGPHLAYLKIAEGCSHHCAFCVIPQIRGKFRSRQPRIILEEAQQLRAGGAQEIVLVAQDSTAYGNDLGSDLEELVASLREVKVPWLRLLYTYPTAITDGLLDLINSQEGLLKYVDLPLQHVSSAVLRKMKRPGDYRSSAALIAKIRASIPRVTIRSSFIVGFPGETEEDFQELKRFLGEMRLNHVGIFQYSREENTPAYNLQPQIPPETKIRRYHELMALQRQISWELNRALVGKGLEVLIDGVSQESDLVLVGRHAGQAPDVDGVVYLGRGNCEPGQMVPVRITKAYPYDLVGEVI